MEQAFQILFDVFVIFFVISFLWYRRKLERELENVWGEISAIWSTLEHLKKVRRIECVETASGAENSAC